MTARMPLNAFRGALAASLLTISLMVSGHAGQQTAPTAPSPSASVRIDNFTFTPAAITIAPGMTVTWTNGDDIPHAILGTNQAFRSKVMDTDEHYSFTFTVPGTYKYFCSIHPHMQGEVIVK